MLDVVLDDAGREWHSVELPDRSAQYAYLVVVRGDGDPERSPRPAGGRDDRAPHRTLGKTCPEDWFAVILATLEEIGESTMHRLSVHILDKDSSIVFKSPFEEALWALVGRGELEMTWEAPVLFRLRSADGAQDGRSLSL
jgi:hypothetical protein